MKSQKTIDPYELLASNNSSFFVLVDELKKVKLKLTADILPQNQVVQCYAVRFIY